MSIQSFAPEHCVNGVAERTGSFRSTLDALSVLANELAGAFAIEPLLECVLRNAVELLGCRSGSLCVTGDRGGSRRLEVDPGVGFRSETDFSVSRRVLSEGVTGAVARAGGAVTFDRYTRIPGGPVDQTASRYFLSVIGVPIRLGSELIGTCVVFADDSLRVFDSADVELLELLALHAAVAIANSRMLTGTLPDDRGNGTQCPTFHEPLTARESEVHSFLQRGVPDKLIAHELGISSKTVEKHVGTILRKTGARNRTEVAVGTVGKLPISRVAGSP